MNYCERCRILTDADRCPECGNLRLRAPRESDLCMVCEKPAVWSEAVADVLREAAVPEMHRGVLGAGLAMTLGQAAERDRFYVRFADLERAKQAVEDLFAPADDAPAEESTGSTPEETELPG